MTELACYSTDNRLSIVFKAFSCTILPLTSQNLTAWLPKRQEHTLSVKFPNFSTRIARATVLIDGDLPLMGKGFVCTVSVFGGSSLLVSGDMTLGQARTSLAFLQQSQGPQVPFRTRSEPPFITSMQHALLIIDRRLTTN